MGNVVEITSESGTIPAYLAVPEAGEGPGVLLMHAWWGLNGFFVEFADRLAREGFVVLAPDLYGGKSGSTLEEAKALIGALDYRQAIKHEEAALDYLLKHEGVRGERVGAVGFSMGGSYATWLATMRPELGALVLFYGGSEQEEDFAEQTDAAMLGHFAEGDEWEPDEGVRALQSQLKSAGKDVNFHFYSGAGHWFMENDRPDNYNAEAADLAWERSVSFLRERLKG